MAALAAAGPIGGPMMRFMMDWADAEGVAHPLARDRDYSTLNFKDEPEEFFAAVRDTLGGPVRPSHQGRAVPGGARPPAPAWPRCTPSPTSAPTSSWPSAEYFVDVDQGERGPVAWAGPWAHLSATPLTTTRRAPHVGEHDAELASRPPAPAAPTAPEPEDRAAAAGAPFDGLHVLDLSWVGVGPMTAGYLASYGATVVKIESSKRPDVLRLNPPFRDGVPGLNNSHFYGDFNAGKMSVGLDLTDPRGREVAWRAIEWADVILESFTPKALAGWDMDYAQIRERNPSVVMLSTCMQGQTGPRRLYRGFGNLMAGLAGFYELTGWPDRTPIMIYGAYTDFISQRFTATALLAALDHRRRTGEGQHIDVAQLEAALQFLGPELLAYELDGRVATRAGNRHPDLVPHGVFPCLPEPERAGRYPDGGRGAEGWVAISCADDEQWRALVELTGLPARGPVGDGRRSAGRRGPHRGAAGVVDGESTRPRHRRPAPAPRGLRAGARRPRAAHRPADPPSRLLGPARPPRLRTGAVLGDAGDDVAHPRHGAGPGAVPRRAHLVRARVDPRLDSDTIAALLVDEVAEITG